MTDYIKHTCDAFDKGLNCAQIVLDEFAEEFGIQQSQARRISAGFGGGVGRMGNHCGVFSAAVIVLGLHCGIEDGDKDPLVDKIKDFTHRFTEEHNSVMCRELLGADISNNDNYRAAIDSNLFKKKCPYFIDSAVRHLRKIIDG